jgi:hypothetical protein
MIISNRNLNCLFNKHLNVVYADKSETRESDNLFNIFQKKNKMTPQFRDFLFSSDFQFNYNYFLLKLILF